MRWFLGHGSPTFASQVVRHEVRKTVSFSNTANAVVWGRGGAYTTGLFDDGSSYNYNITSCEVVPGSVTATSATLRTYVFARYLSGQFIGWYPCAPSEVTFGYAVHGSPGPVSVSISGPMCVSSKGATATLTALPSGGDGVNYSYSWSPGGYTTQTITRPISSCPQQYTVTVTSAGLSASATKKVYYGGGTCNCGGALFKHSGSETGLPEKFDLSQNYPNPFNPSTTIHFDLPESASAKLIVYNMQGQLIRTLVNESLPAGYHVVDWDGADDTGHQVASGIYVYRLEAGSFVQSLKMTLVK